MNESTQDNYYLNKEGDDFFNRSVKNTATAKLRDNKKRILNFIEDTIDIHNIENVLEYGCNYGDLLNYLNQNFNMNVYGIEASNVAVEHGNKLFSKNINLSQGTIANNKINQNKEFTNFFDLIIIEDVFGWVSRETLLQSIANIDNALKDGGLIFIRDFYMNQRVKNKNSHVADEEVYCFKLPEGYSKIFTDTGMYEIIAQNIWNDNKKELSGNFKTTREFENRWFDTIIKKSYNKYYL